MATNFSTIIINYSIVIDNAFIIESKHFSKIIYYYTYYV